MGIDINWNLARPTDVGGMFADGLERGQALRKEHDTRRALTAFDADPNTGNLNALMTLSPELGMRVAQFQHQQSDSARGDRFRAAYADYLTGPDQTPAMGAPAAAPVGLSPSPAQPMAPVQQPDGGSQPGPALAPQPAAQDMDHNAAIAAQGEVFRRMAVEDPAGAAAARNAAYDSASKHLKLADDAYGFAIARLSNVTDDASYQALLNESDTRFGPLGLNIRSMVPPSYPGPDGLQRLLMSAMDARQQVAATNQRLRLDWDIQDDRLDNERLDRNVDSEIEDRNQRRDLTRRGQDMISGDRRYSVDHADTRQASRGSGGGAPTPSRIVGQIMQKYQRGETLTAREQELLRNATTSRRRGIAGTTPGTPGTSRENPVAVGTPQEAERLPVGTWFKNERGQTYQRH